MIVLNYCWSHPPFLMLPTCLAYETDTLVCPGLPWGQVRFWAQLGKMMTGRWADEYLNLARSGLPAERAPIIRWGQWSQVTCLHDVAWPQWPLWPVLQWEIMHRLCRSPNSPACPEQGPSPLRGSTLKKAEGWGSQGTTNFTLNIRMELMSQVADMTLMTVMH